LPLFSVERGRSPTAGQSYSNDLQIIIMNTPGGLFTPLKLTLLNVEHSQEEIEKVGGLICVLSKNTEEYTVWCKNQQVVLRQFQTHSKLPIASHGGRGAARCVWLASGFISPFVRHKFYNHFFFLSRLPRMSS